MIVGGVKSSKVTFMAPSGQVQMVFKVGGWGILDLVLLVIILSNI